MIELFLTLVAGSLSFLSIFLIYLPKDIKRKSLRPLFLMVPVIGFWWFTAGALAAPGLTTTVVYPSYTATVTSASGNSVTTYPAVSVATTPQAGSADSSMFFNVWLAMLFFDFFMLVLWFVMLLRDNSMELLHESEDALGTMERNYGHH